MAQVDDTSGGQFVPVLAQLGDDLVLVHEPILSYISFLLNKIEDACHTWTVEGREGIAPTDWHIDTRRSGTPPKKLQSV